MLTLCINTAGHLNTVAIVKNGKCLAEENWQSQRNETKTILEKMKTALEQAKVQIEDVDALNVVQGIGGFTSLRVGITVANTIAYAQKIPLYATSVFELWERRAKHPPTHLEGDLAEVAILIDAGRNECFYFSASSYKPQASSFFAPQIIPNAQLAELKEKFWVGEINEKQKRILPENCQDLSELKSPGKAFAEIDLHDKKAYEFLEPWYGREPNVSEPRKAEAIEK